jgi:hypothetical protein
LGCIKHAADVGQCLSLIHAVQNRRKIFANRFANGLILGLRLKTEISCAGMVEGGIPPPRVTWVIRLTSLLTEKSVMLVDLREEPVAAWLSAYTFPQLSTTLGSHLQ